MQKQTLISSEKSSQFTLDRSYVDSNS